MNNSLKITCLTIASALLFLVGNKALAQSPYSLSPVWYFGVGSGLDFPNGNYPTSADPIPTSHPGVNMIESSMGICDQTGAIAVYSNTMQVRNVTNATIVNLVTDNTCGGSATEGGIAIPDPASPSDSYYLFIANDITLGSCQQRGINYYKFQKNGLGQAVNVPPFTNLVTGAFADETITSANDGQGNYWIIAHSNSSNTFKVFKIEPTGITALADQVKAPATPNVLSTNSQSYSKISPCQDKIAWSGGGTLVVYEFNRTTGIIGNLILSKTGVSHGSGVEFSNNGQIVYYAAQGAAVNWHDLVGGTTGTIAGSSSWSMQMGPDGKIYTSGIQDATAAGVIQTPNSPGSTLYTTVALIGSMHRGIINVAWLNPQLPEINTSINSCTVDFSYVFQNYFSADIDIDPSSILWDFNLSNPATATSTAAAPSHTYATDGTYDVSLTFMDATCGHTFTATTQVTVACGILPPGCNFNIAASIDPITNVDIDDKTPVLINLIGSNSIFDASITDPEKYYWINGSADTSLAFATTANTSLTFAYNGLGGNIPQGTYEIYLVIREGLCMDTVKATFEVTYFYIPNLVTPNGDPHNERFEISNTGGRFDVEIFNRWGEKIYNEKGYTKNWDLAKASDGIYYYEVADTKSGKKYKGWVQITR